MQGVGAPVASAAGRDARARVVLIRVVVDDLANDLRRPEAYPPPLPHTVELRETHVSWVMLTESDVYKVKKPVSLGFLDFSTLEARRKACEAEVVLNNRLATGVYFGIVPVRRGPDGRLHLHEGGEIVDWAVHMLRLPDAHRADVRLARGQLTAADIDKVADHLAAFHARCERTPEIAAHGAVDRVEANVVENFAQTREEVTRFLSGAQAKEVEDFQRGILRDRAMLFERRRAEGFVRDGHGDLRLEHVYFGGRDEVSAPDGITVLDCIEFNDRFRCADVGADLAFLSMDLAAHGRVDLAERLVARYARATDDFDLYALIDFFESYRAWVRGKVSVMLAASTDDEALRAKAEADARKHLLLALSADRASLLTPVVVAVGGIIASGKSTVAEALADRLAAPVVDADRTRKSMLGVAHRNPLHVGAFEGPYDPRFTDEVYDEVVRRADVVLTSGRPVVLDASFRTRALRARARALAEKHGVPFLFVECRVPEDVCIARLEQREARGGVSDGRRAIFADFVRRVEPVDELASGEHLVLDTSRPLASSLETLGEHLRTWPTGLTG